MIRRLTAFLLIAWVLGFVWFATTLPQPLAMEKTDAVVVPTGGGGRIDRGLDVLRKGAAQKMLVTGVDTEVKPEEFSAEYDVEDRLMACCITLGFAALDTRGNARETSAWMEQEGYSSLRLVTSDWHMRRTALELGSRLPDEINVVRDAVQTEPSLTTLLLEYHKYLAAWALSLT